MELSVKFSFKGPLIIEEKEFMKKNNIIYGTSKSIHGGEIINAIIISSSTIAISELIKFLKELIQEKIIKFEYRGFTINEYSLQKIKQRIEEINTLLETNEEDVEEQNGN